MQCFTVYTTKKFFSNHFNLNLSCWSLKFTSYSSILNGNKKNTLSSLKESYLYLKKKSHKIAWLKFLKVNNAKFFSIFSHWYCRSPLMMSCILQDHLLGEIVLPCYLYRKLTSGSQKEHDTTQFSWVYLLRSLRLI